MSELANTKKMYLPRSIVLFLIVLIVFEVN